MATIGEIFTEEEIEKAKAIHAEAGPGEFATRCADEVVRPVIDRINRTLGQRNDPKYLAYALENLLNQASRPRM